MVGRTIGGTNKMIRRRFMTIATGAGFGSTILSQSPVMSAYAQDEHTKIRSIVQCRLVALQGSTLYCSEGGVPHTLSLSPALRVWKGKERQGVAELRNGDMLDLKLEPGQDGSYVVTYIWANLVKYEGIIGSAVGNRLELFPFSPRTAQTTASTAVTFVIDSDTEIASGRTLADLRPQRPALIIGLLLENGTVKATKVILANQK